MDETQGPRGPRLTRGCRRASVGGMEYERPYLFTGPLVLAILEGRKTETRRVLMGPDVEAIVDHPGDRWQQLPGRDRGHGRLSNRGRWVLDRGGKVSFLSRPSVMPGDGLWVKETWRVDEGWDNTPPRDLPARLARRDDHIYYEATKGTMRQGLHPGRIRQSIFMPRWASRITRKVKAVMVERLQAITEAGAVAEGFGAACPCVEVPCTDCSGTGWAPGDDPLTDFRCTWDTINAQRPGKRPISWAADPLVVVTTFEGP